MTKTDLSHAIDAAPASFDVHLPIAVFLTEGIDLAKFLDEHWEPVKEGGKTVLPGLSSVAHKKTAGYALSAHTSEEIRELASRAKDAQTEVHLAENPHVSRADLQRASHVLSEIEAALDFLFDDGKEDENDEKLAAIQQSHAHDSTVAAQAQALDDYAALAGTRRKDLDGLGDFDVALIDEAPAIAAKLRARGAGASAPSPEQRLAIERRNKILNALRVRVQAARAAVRFVFRSHPDVARRATSAYERRRRAASRRRAAAAAKNVAPTTP